MNLFFLKDLFSALSIETAVISLAVLFVTMVFAKFVQTVVNIKIKNFLSSQTQPLDAVMLNKLDIPLVLMIYIIGICVVFQILQPSNSVYPVKTFTDIFCKVSVVWIFTWLCFVLVDVSDKLLACKYNASDNPVLKFMPLFNRSIKAVIAFVVLVMILQDFGYSVATLVAGFGILGVAISFASKEYIANIFGAFSVIVDNTYQVGDVICIDKTVAGQNVEGIVEDISLRSTKIRAFDDSLMIVPNNYMGSAVVKNLSRITKRQIYEFVEIAYDTPVEKIEQAVLICQRVASENPKILDDHKIYLNQLGSGSFKIIVNMFADTTDFIEYLKIRQDYFLKVIDEFNKENVEFALSSQILTLKKD